MFTEAKCRELCEPGTQPEHLTVELPGHHILSQELCSPSSTDSSPEPEQSTVCPERRSSFLLGQVPTWEDSFHKTFSVEMSANFFSKFTVTAAFHLARKFHNRARKKQLMLSLLKAIPYCLRGGCNVKNGRASPDLSPSNPLFLFPCSAFPGSQFSQLLTGLGQQQ